jgi:hypothetical protein
MLPTEALQRLLPEVERLGLVQNQLDLLLGVILNTDLLIAIVLLDQVILCLLKLLLKLLQVLPGRAITLAKELLPFSKEAMRVITLLSLNLKPSLL